MHYIKNPHPSKIGIQVEEHASKPGDCREFQSQTVRGSNHSDFQAVTSMSETLGESIKAPIVVRIRVCTFTLEQTMISKDYCS